MSYDFIIVFTSLKKYIRTTKKYEFSNETILEYSHELPTTDSLTSYSCPRKRNLEVLESH